MAVTSVGDILINSKPFLVAKNSYSLIESVKSYPRIGGASAPENRHGDNYTYWSQSDWTGDSTPDWLADGPFYDGYGIDLSSIAGRITVAKQLAQTQADAANIGHVCFTAGTTRAWFIGKTNGTGYHSTDGIVWNSLANVLAVGVTPTSFGDYRGTTYVGASNGGLYSIGTGTVFTAIAGPLATPSYVLGAYKGRLWVGYANALYTYDGAVFTQQFTGIVDGTPTIGTIGASVLYMITAGPSSRILMTDSNQLHQIATLSNDFLPRAAVFTDSLMIFGSATDDNIVFGQVWRLDRNGLKPIYQVGSLTNDYGIRSAILYGQNVYWGANQRTGIGVYDPSMDLFQDAQQGFYVSSVITSIAGVVDGIVQFNNVIYCSIQSNGIYKQTTPGAWMLLSSMYDANTKNIMKTWAFGEIHHTAVLAGQSFSLDTLKDGTIPNNWGSQSTLGTTETIILAPTQYRSPYLQYRLSGNANGQSFAILDISLAFIETPTNPKREWNMTLVLEGGASSQMQIMRDGSPNTRSATAMLAELNALWNTPVLFDDLDGTQYTVIFKVPRAHLPIEPIKQVQTGAITDALIYYRVTLAELSGGSLVSNTYGRAVYG